MSDLRGVDRTYEKTLTPLGADQRLLQQLDLLFQAPRQFKVTEATGSLLSSPDVLIKFFSTDLLNFRVEYGLRGDEWGR
jgi:hypothetical protein